MPAILNQKKSYGRHIFGTHEEWKNIGPWDSNLRSFWQYSRRNQIDMITAQNFGKYYFQKSFSWASCGFTTQIDGY